MEEYNSVLKEAIAELQLAGYEPTEIYNILRETGTVVPLGHQRAEINATVERYLLAKSRLTDNLARQAIAEVLLDPRQVPTQDINIVPEVPKLQAAGKTQTEIYNNLKARATFGLLGHQQAPRNKVLTYIMKMNGNYWFRKQVLNEERKNCPSSLPKKALAEPTDARQGPTETFNIPMEIGDDQLAFRNPQAERFFIEKKLRQDARQGPTETFNILMEIGDDQLAFRNPQAVRYFMEKKLRQESMRKDQKS
jgi:hypothetical protein